MKSKHFTIPIPIFDWDVVVSYLEKDEVIFKYLKRQGHPKDKIETDLYVEKCEYGVTVKLPDNTVVIRINRAEDKNILQKTIAHESHHASDYILTHIGMKFAMGISDEAFVYLQDYIAGIIFKKLGC